MPSFDLRGIQVAEYVNTGGDVGYGDPMSVGDAMSCNLELRFAEGRLYAESALAEYMKLAIGGVISVGTKYIPVNAQKLMYGYTDKTRTVGAQEVSGVLSTAKDIGKEVGVAFYAPDKIDGETKYTCCFVYRALFGPPSMAYQTKGENITFQTPTTSGEFLADHSDKQNLMEVATVDTEAEAKAWCAAVFAAAEVEEEEEEEEEEV